MSKNCLSKDEELRKGDQLMSNNEEWKAVFQDDGNFILYGWKPMWSSETHGSDAHSLIMQADCNVVIYNEAGTPRWNTCTGGFVSSKCHLELTDDGKLELFKEDKLWTTEGK